MLIRVPEPPSRPTSNRRRVRMRLVLTCAFTVTAALFVAEAFQRYENWSFRQELAGAPSATSVLDYVREGFGATASDEPGSTVPQEDGSEVSNGALLGRIEIARVGLSALIREGANQAILSRAAGHIPFTSLPGQGGNIGVAGHRESLFRKLRYVRTGDLVTFESADGIRKYRVISTRVVTPNDTSVLRVDGGLQTAAQELLTLVTCYPFRAFGSAPERFIVQARLVAVSGPPAVRKPA